MTTPTQAGWYDDPSNPSAQRYFDGNDWTPYRQRKAAGAPTPPPVPSQTAAYTPPPTPPSYAPPPDPASYAPAPDPSSYAPPPDPYSYASSQPPAVAPSPVAYAGGGQPPDSHLVMAVLSTFLCCFPFGIVAIINANKVSNLWALGQYEAAQAAADSAKKWAMYSAIAWACLATIAFVVGVVLPLVGLSLLGGVAATNP